MSLDKHAFFLLLWVAIGFESICRLRAWWGSAAKTCVLLSKFLKIQKIMEKISKDRDRGHLRNIVEGWKRRLPCGKAYQAKRLVHVWVYRDEHLWVRALKIFAFQAWQITYSLTNRSMTARYIDQEIPLLIKMNQIHHINLFKSQKHWKLLNGST